MPKGKAVSTREKVLAEVPSPDIPIQSTTQWLAMKDSSMLGSSDLVVHNNLETLHASQALINRKLDFILQEVEKISAKVGNSNRAAAKAANANKSKASPTSPHVETLRIKLVEWVKETPGMTVAGKRTAKNTKRAGEFREWLAGNLDDNVQDEIDEMNDDEFMAMFLQLAASHNDSTRAKPKTPVTKKRQGKAEANSDSFIDDDDDDDPAGEHGESRRAIESSEEPVRAGMPTPVATGRKRKAEYESLDEEDMAPTARRMTFRARHSVHDNSDSEL